MAELRKDPVIGRWVIIATERSKRPGGEFLSREAATADTLREASCPFCEGNEAQTPSEVLAFREAGSRPDEPGWWCRIVPNKYPAMDVEGHVQRVGEGMYDMMNGIGAHEVVIESPQHNADLGDLPEKQIEEILWAYRERMLELHRDLRYQYVMVFKNHGHRAGATLAHPHSQIIALPIVPKRVQEELDGAAAYYRYKERCVFCDVIHQERRDDSRVLAENDTFMAFHPYASRFPYEVWIVPRQHESFFSDIQIGEVSSLASVLKAILQRFKTLLGDPAYNFVIHTAPFTEEDTPYYHWHIELIPRLTRVAGFEWGTGFYINPIAPEEAAKVMNAEKKPADLEEEAAGA